MATEYTVRSKYLKFDTTEVVIHRESPYTIFARELQGDQTAKSDEELIEAVKDIIRTELDPGAAIVKAQAQIEQANQKIAHNESEQNRLSALTNKIDKVVRVMAQDSIMGEKIAYGTTYKEMVELFPLAEVGKVYEPGAIFAVEDPSYTEVNGEGKRILIQTNRSFTYQGETLAQLEGAPSQNGLLATWKFNAPKATNEQ